MATPNYGNLLTEVQTRLYNLISADTTSLTTITESSESVAWTINGNCTVVDGVPKELIQGYGYPYIIIPNGTRSERILTITKKFVTINTDIMIYATREKVVRVLTDQVCKLMEDAKYTANFSSSQLDFKNIVSSTLTPRVLPNNDVEYGMMLSVTFEYRGD